MHRKGLECQAKVQLLSGDPSQGESVTGAFEAGSEMITPWTEIIWAGMSSGAEGRGKDQVGGTQVGRLM